MQHKYFALGGKLSWGPWRDLVTQASGGLEYGMAEGSLVGLRGFGSSNHEDLKMMMMMTDLNTNSLDHTRAQSVLGASSPSHMRHLPPGCLWVLRVSRENPEKWVRAWG